MSVITLGDICRWFERSDDNIKKDTKYYFCFKNTYSNQNYNEGTNIIEYVDYMESNPLEWFKKSDPSQKAAKSNGNIRTAFNYLFNENKDVIELLGKERCERIITIIKKTLSAHKDEIVNYKNNILNDIESDMISVASGVSSDDEEVLVGKADGLTEQIVDKRYDNLKKKYEELEIMIMHLRKENSAYRIYLEKTLDAAMWELLKNLT